jgi:integrase
MRAKIALYGRVNQKFVAARYVKNVPQPVPDASSYYARFTDETGKPTRKPLGSDFAKAVLAITNLGTVRKYSLLGIAAPVGIGVEPKEKASAGKSLDSLLSDYLEEVRIDPEKTEKTYVTYRGNLRHWVKFCNEPPEKCGPFVFPTGITYKVLVAYKHYLQAMPDYEPNTIFTIFLHTTIFLVWCGVRPIDLDFKTEKDWPKQIKRIPEQYDDEEIDALRAAGDSTDRLMIDTFLCSGMRKGELAHAVYGDIDFKASIWSVRRKPQFNWQPKKNKERDIPVPHWLTQEIKERMIRGNRKKNDLIIFNRKGEPQKGMLQRLKVIGKRAGHSGRIDVHKFRATAITRWLEAGVDTYEIMGYVGHENPYTILYYKAKLNIRKKVVHDRATAAFSQFGPGAIAAD